jgi:hypothetical protein
MSETTFRMRRTAIFFLTALLLAPLAALQVASGAPWASGSALKRENSCRERVGI